MKNAFTYLVMVASTRCVSVAILLIVVSTYGLTILTHVTPTSSAPVQTVLFLLCRCPSLLRPGTVPGSGWEEFVINKTSARRKKLKPSLCGIRSFKNRAKF